MGRPPAIKCEANLRNLSVSLTRKIKFSKSTNVVPGSNLLLLFGEFLLPVPDDTLPCDTVSLLIEVLIQELKNSILLLADSE
jgi:hypothetical protein